jgi:hypothetical protein
VLRALPREHYHWSVVAEKGSAGQAGRELEGRVDELFCTADFIPAEQPIDRFLEYLLTSRNVAMVFGLASPAAARCMSAWREHYPELRLADLVDEAALRTEGMTRLTDLQPVLDSIVESAARVCGIDDVLLRLHEGNLRVPRAHFGPIPIPDARAVISIDEPQIGWMHEHGTLHIPDVRAQNDIPMLAPFGNYRTLLQVPLHQQGELIGALAARRTEVRPFTPAQIKLLETFADQAVIAIENVRLFNELKEALEQQTATSEILGVIASSPTDNQPVLNTVAENAARLCEAGDAQIRLVEGDGTRLVASFGTLPAQPEFRPLVH